MTYKHCIKNKLKQKGYSVMLPLSNFKRFVPKVKSGLIVYDYVICHRDIKIAYKKVATNQDYSVYIFHF